MSNTYNPVVNRDAIMQQIAVNLTKIKTAMNWTNSKMAKITGVTEPTVGFYLKGTRLPDLAYLIDLCTLKELKNKNIEIKIDDLLSDSFDPVRAQNGNNSTVSSGTFSEEHRDMLGNYFCYFYDQSKPVHDQNHKTARELRFGVMSIYDYYNCVTGENKIKVYASFYKEAEIHKATNSKKELDAICDSNTIVAERNEQIQSHYGKINDEKDAGVYEGDVSFGKQHIFVNFNSSTYSDNALMILYAPPKRADSEYLGGIGSIASVAHGSMRMPTAQKIIISKHSLDCSFEEIADHLSLCSAPISQTEEAIALTEICRRLYDDNTSIGGFLDENDKTAIIENRLNQLVRNYIEKNVCCVGSVSKEEDRQVYELIKRYVK